MVRGFFGNPVDGALDSWDYSGAINEYPIRSVLVRYNFNGNKGLHLKLKEGEVFDLVVLRGGSQTTLHRDYGNLVEGSNMVVMHAFTKPDPVQVVRFQRPRDESSLVFFNSNSGPIADVGFFRVDVMDSPPTAGVEILRVGGFTTLPLPVYSWDTADLSRALTNKFGSTNSSVRTLSALNPAGSPVDLRAGEAAHFVTPAITVRRGLASLGFDLVLTGGGTNLTGSVTVHDPLNPRLDLAFVPFTVAQTNRLQMWVDFPDQVLMPTNHVTGSPNAIGVTLKFDSAVRVAAPDGGAPQFRLEYTSPEAALGEAFAHRKFLLKNFVALLSELRPWAMLGYSGPQTFAQYLQTLSVSTARRTSETFLTLEQCRALAATDPLVEQYTEWIYLRNLSSLKTVTVPAPPAGVPEWAWYSRLAWLEARRIASWWMVNRLTSSGEFGGGVGDDTDLYQELADLPFFEEDSEFSVQLRSAARALGDLASSTTLTNGVNRLSLDALHAYEEGINHLALISLWNYGDPQALERVMDSARNLERMTVVASSGRRHFRTKMNVGWPDLGLSSPMGIDGDGTPLLWHPALHLGWYHGGGPAITRVSEWAATWLPYLSVSPFATDIDVNLGTVIASTTRPLNGGYASQAAVMTALARLTGDRRYIQSFIDTYRAKVRSYPAVWFADELESAGLLAGEASDVMQWLAQFNGNLAIRLNRDPGVLKNLALGVQRPSDAAVNTLLDAARWPDMYTTAEQFTDRISPWILEVASRAYLGGFNHRNKFNHAKAVSWSGFGTNYSALVLQQPSNSVKVALYNHGQSSLAGQMRVWELDHGRYELTVRPDLNGDFIADGAGALSEHVLRRGDAVPVSLPPGQATIVELRQLQALGSLRGLSDLALSEVRLFTDPAVVSGWVHNIGASPASGVVVSLLGPGGAVVGEANLGTVDSATDLVPRRKAFSIPVSGSTDGLQVLVDRAGTVNEINERNNAVQLGL